MKKILSLLLLLSLSIFSFFSCGNEETNSETPPETDQTSIRIGYMSGPTGMGMAKLINDNNGTQGNDKYSFKSYENTKLATADLLSGNIDVICLPTNEAATNFNTANNNSVVLAINTLNTLFLVTDENTTVTSFDELDGKTIYTCKNGTPKIILEYLLKKSGVNAIVSTNIDGKEILTPKDLGAEIVSGTIEIAVAPEPIVTSSTLQRKQSGKAAYSVDLNLDNVWKEHNDTELTMGCIVANKNFVKDHKTVIDAFLNEYESSINFIASHNNIDSAADYIVKSGIMAAAPAATSALNNLGNSIAYIDGADMISALEAFYDAIGIEKPSNDFYYEK